MKKKEDIALLSLVFVLLSMLFILKTANCEGCAFGTQPPQEEARITPAVETFSYPVLIDKGSPPILSAQAGIIMDPESKKVLYEKNAKLRFSPASTAKMMTALVALEHFQLDDTLIVKTEITIPATMYLRFGEEISFQNLLYGLLLASGNDAAIAIAENYPGGSKAFVERMNTKGKELALFDSKFVDPAGLDDDGNYTTAFDLARLASEAIENETFAKVVATRERQVFDKTGKISHQLSNLNKLLGQNGVNGIKTGTTTGAGEVLVASAERDGHTLVTVVMKSQNRFSDSSALLDWVFSKVTFIDPLRDVSKSHQ